MSFKKSFAMALISAFILSESAFAVAGTESSGGGNTLKGRPIESYAIANLKKDFPQFETAKIYLFNQLNQFCPDFTKVLKTNIEERTWYLIPAPFENLPSTNTGLYFESHQAAYQLSSEVYFSIPELRAMRSDEDREDLFKHEIIMTGIPNKNPEGHAAVRKVMGLLKNHEICGEGFCSEIGKLGFGNYPVRKIDSEKLEDEPVKDELSQLVLENYLKLAKKRKLTENAAPINNNIESMRDLGCYGPQLTKILLKPIAEDEYVQKSQSLKNWLKQVTVKKKNLCLVYSAEGEDGSGAGIYFGILIPKSGKLKFSDKDIFFVGFED